jgi:hypothetical protein
MRRQSVLLDASLGPEASDGEVQVIVLVGLDVVHDGGLLVRPFERSSLMVGLAAFILILSVSVYPWEEHKAPFGFPPYLTQDAELLIWSQFPLHALASPGHMM